MAKSHSHAIGMQKRKDLEDMAIGAFKPLLLMSALLAAFTNGSEDVGKFIKPLVKAMNIDKPTDN